MNLTMNEERFRNGIDPEEYLNSLQNYRSLVRRLAEQAPDPPPLADELREAAARFAQPVRATMMTEDWCGDSACNFPLLRILFPRAGIPFRVFRGSETPELKAAYEADGDDHIPAVSLWDGAGREVVRWIEAPEAVQRKKEAWKSERPHFMELYARRSVDKEAAKQFPVLYRELLETMAGWYQADMWTQTAGEIVDRLRSAVPPGA